MKDIAYLYHIGKLVGVVDKIAAETAAVAVVTHELKRLHMSETLMTTEILPQSLYSVCIFMYDSRYVLLYTRLSLFIYQNCRECCMDHFNPIERFAKSAPPPPLGVVCLIS